MMFEQQRKMENERLKPSSSSDPNDDSTPPSNTTEKPNNDTKKLTDQKSTSTIEVNKTNINGGCSPRALKRARSDQESIS